MTRATKRETADQVTLKILTRRYGLKRVYFFRLESHRERKLAWAKANLLFLSSWYKKCTMLKFPHLAGHFLQVFIQESSDLGNLGGYCIFF